MSFWRNIWIFLLLESVLFISACSVNLVQGTSDMSSQNQAAATPLFDRIPLVLGNDTLWLSQDLVNTYNLVSSQETYPRQQCLGKAVIRAQVTQNSQPDSWSVPLILIPFWPITPLDETWTYELDARIYCGKDLVKQVTFKEEETIHAKFYGKLRSDLLNEASKEMHRKLAHRFAFELNYHYNADMSTRSDY